MILLGDIASDIIKAKHGNNLDSSAPKTSNGEDGKETDIAASGSDVTKGTLSPKEGRPDIGGLATMAAAAAAKRGKSKKKERPDLGGLAAMAAEAASKRKQNK